MLHVIIISFTDENDILSGDANNPAVTQQSVNHWQCIVDIFETRCIFTKSVITEDDNCLLYTSDAADE